MALPSTTQEFAATVTNGFERTLTEIGAWSNSTFDRLRKSVLPDRDEPLVVAGAPAATTTESRSRSARALALIPQVMVGAVITMLIVAVGLFVFRNLYSDRIYPAIVVGDVNVGGLTAAQAEDRLTERATDLEQGTIAFNYNGQTWTPTLTELGATVNLNDSVSAAEQLGRGGDAASRLAFTGDILQSDQVVPLQTTIDQAVLDTWFDKVDRDINNPAIDAQIVVDGAKVTVSKDSTGIVVDRTAARARIFSALGSLQPIDVELPTRVDNPKIVVSDLGEVRATVEQSIQTPLRVKFENQTWKIEGTKLAPYILVTTVLEHGAPVAKLSFDTERLATDLRTQFAPEVNREPENASVGWNDDKGRVVALDPSTTGVTLKAGDFAEAVAAGFLNGHQLVEIPVVITRPEIDDENLGALGITERIGSGDSNFAGGSWQRDENIYVGTSFLNGTLVPPGGTFSFNQAVGEITYDKGYQDAAVVVAEEIGRDVGGGICQVSTTVFRAAIYAGMPIVEWHPHTYRLPGYELDGWGPGFDASILQLGSNQEYWADFKFENYTNSWLLVESWTSYPTLIVNIYGTDIGREVEVTWWGINGGKNTGFTRRLYDDAGEVVAERDFATYFK